MYYQIYLQTILNKPTANTNNIRQELTTKSTRLTKYIDGPHQIPSTGHTKCINAQDYIYSLHLDINILWQMISTGHTIDIYK